MPCAAETTPKTIRMAAAASAPRRRARRPSMRCCMGTPPSMRCALRRRSRRRQRSSSAAERARAAPSGGNALTPARRGRGAAHRLSRLMLHVEARPTSAVAFASEVGFHLLVRSGHRACTGRRLRRPRPCRPDRHAEGLLARPARSRRSTSYRRTTAVRRSRPKPSQWLAAGARAVVVVDPPSRTATVYRAGGEIARPARRRAARPRRRRPRLVAAGRRLLRLKRAALACPAMPKIVTLPGDGIGPEIMAPALELLRTISEDFSFEEHALRRRRDRRCTAPR